MSHIGIMQGRLVPPIDNRIQCFPRDNWQDEFVLAAQAGIDSIEWIYDLYGADINPLAVDSGLEKVKTLSESSGVRVLSICADYFMDRPLVRSLPSERAERLAIMEWLLERGRLLGINRMVVPFVDASRIETEFEMETVVDLLEHLLPIARNKNIEIHLETSLPPDRFSTLLNRIPDPFLKANYDSGNSASLGFNPRDEFASYGKRVGSVHIKDRILGGGTVPLGQGNANFVLLAECLDSIGYSGDYILQVAREVNGDEKTWIRKNKLFVQDLFLSEKES